MPLPDYLMQYADTPDLPEGMLDGILAEYDADAAGFSTQIEDLTGQLNGRNNDLAALQAKLDAALAAAPAAVDPAALETLDDDEDVEEDDASLDDLFSDSPEDDEDD